VSLVKPADNYSKPELIALIDRLKRGDDEVIHELVVFTLTESRGLWHGRARAKICRNLKNHPPDATLQSNLVDTIAERLIYGRFSEQFRDQLSMAIRFAPDRMRTIAESLLTSDKTYVRRYADWVIKTLNQREVQANNPMARSGRPTAS
jgi:hypothetical protein